MKLFIVALLAVAGSAMADLRLEEHTVFLESAKANPMQAFNKWMAQHGKGYANDANESEKRFKIWQANLEYVLEHNAKGKSYWLGMNSLADLTQEEYAQRYLGFSKADLKERRAKAAASNAVRTFKYANVDDSSLPASIDWREKGAVTRVKNQQQCGSCWAFSATGAVEGINAIVTNELETLSEQLLVDCDTLKNQGCNGGLMDYAFEFIIRNKGIDTEDHYPYTATDNACQEKHKRHGVVTIDDYEDVPENSEVDLKKAAAHQPVSVAIEAGQKAFQLYMGGVFADESCGTDLDHGVLVVGYGTDATSGLDYWIVKNSWGGEWGDKGYIRMAQGVTAKEGLCGIAMVASYPTKRGPNPPKPGPDPGPDPEPQPEPEPEPEPVVCDASSQCPPATTCCCVTEFFGMCFSWGCCMVEKAVCCDDREHCCPADLPVCDSVGGRCLPAAGAPAALGKPWLAKTPAQRSWPGLDGLWMRGAAKGAMGGCTKGAKHSAAATTAAATTAAATTAATASTPKMQLSGGGSSKSKQAVA